MLPDQPHGIVLVVDDMPQSLGLLCETLESAGYTVVIARDGATALARLDLVAPDAILLDALMPGLTGFETCRAIKAQPALSHIPVIFMTGLSDTEHIVDGFRSGGVDYVVKPVRAEEVLARLTTHTRNARAARLARDALDIGGRGVLVVDRQGRVAWRSPKAAAWLPAFVRDADRAVPASWTDGDGSTTEWRLADGDARELRVQYLGPVGLGERMYLLELRPAQAPRLSRIAQAALTPREAEVLSWVAKGKTNKDVGDILGMSPRTVNKHLEHIYEKLGVETRAAAAALAAGQMPA